MPETKCRAGIQGVFYPGPFSHQRPQVAAAQHRITRFPHELLHLARQYVFPVPFPPAPRSMFAVHHRTRAPLELRDPLRRYVAPALTELDRRGPRHLARQAMMPECVYTVGSLKLYRIIWRATQVEGVNQHR
jgi:hypothetical protein